MSCVEEAVFKHRTETPVLLSSHPLVTALSHQWPCGGSVWLIIILQNHFICWQLNDSVRDLLEKSNSKLKKSISLSIVSFVFFKALVSFFVLFPLPFQLRGEKQCQRKQNF